MAGYLNIRNAWYLGVEDSNSGESAHEPKPKRQRSASKTKKDDVLTLQLYSSANS